MPGSPSETLLLTHRGTQTLQQRCRTARAETWLGRSAGGRIAAISTTSHSTSAASQPLLRTVDLSADVAEGNKSVSTISPPRERPKHTEGWQKCVPQHCGSDMLFCNPDRSYLWGTWTQLQATSQLPAHTPRHLCAAG